VDAVGRNGGGTFPNLRGGPPKPIGNRGQRTRPKLANALANCAVTIQGSPQASEPGESPKEGSPIDAYHIFSTEPTIVQQPHRIVQKAHGIVQKPT
jgi:hypothetical protein